ncbi:histone chaperone ASF1-like [Cryptomeria japonica]|uniref:histone chaperone ASF1-like n=1 Tax=Cryptomeria japonica TaxID=3369 RepID=UPI0027DAA785|nr:histone chaperone ASF1-like [Cryptomeria japonica]
MVGRVNDIAEETADKWDIFFVEKKKQEELNQPKKTFKDSTEVHNDIASSRNIVEQLVENVEVEIQTEHTEQPLDSGMNIGSIDADTEKLTKTEKPTEIPTTDNTEKPTEKPTEAQDREEKDKEDEENKDEEDEEGKQDEEGEENEEGEEEEEVKEDELDAVPHHSEDDTIALDPLRIPLQVETDPIRDLDSSLDCPMPTVKRHYECGEPSGSQSHEVPFHHPYW